MNHTVSNKILTKGGAFLIQETQPENVFIPEEFAEEQLQLAKMCEDFIQAEIYPHLEKIDKMEGNIMVSLLDKAADLGLLGLSIPEEFNGYGMDFTTNMLTSEVLGASHSFAVALMAHTGIGTLPILYFGNEEQKRKYLPGLATGKLKASYCLTEPGSGSDALGAKTKAILSEDGKHYIITGQKMWITNAGFADIFIVFAKIDGEKFTGFILERSMPGISFGEEEKKMGIKGSSTRQVFFNEVKVPVENVLGEIGKGHKIAFNILNIGRIKLAAATLGAAKKCSTTAIQYANERHQFNKPISSFGAIKHKLAEQIIRIYTLESATYRATHDISETEKLNLANGMSFNDALLGAAEEYSVECSMLKVAGSEALDYVVDEGVQIFGGMGFSAEAPMDRAYRDARINRIFEGTNEINRMLTVDMIMKKALKGQLDLLTPAMSVQKELMSIPDFNEGRGGGFLEYEKFMVKNFKKAILMTAGAAAQKLMQKLAHEQEILMNIADMCIWTYLAESTLIRVEKLAQLKGKESIELPLAILQTYIHDVADYIGLAGKNAICAFASGDELKMMLLGIKRFTKHDPLNTKELRRKIADAAIQKGSYLFS